MGDFDLMYNQVKDLKEGKTVGKPIYNHVSGLLDPAEEIESPEILIIEGLHPFYDQRVRDLLDFKIYLDISDDVKFAWKIQRDMKERGHSLESIKASIESRKPDFDAYIDPQKKDADVIIEVLPTQLLPGETEGNVLRVRLIQKEGNKLEELIYVESHLSNASTKFYGEITQQMLKNSTFPGSTRPSSASRSARCTSASPRPRSPPSPPPPRRRSARRLVGRVWRGRPPRLRRRQTAHRTGRGRAAGQRGRGCAAGHAHLRVGREATRTAWLNFYREQNSTLH